MRDGESALSLNARESSDCTSDDRQSEWTSVELTRVIAVGDSDVLTCNVLHKHKLPCGVGITTCTSLPEACPEAANNVEVREPAVRNDTLDTHFGPIPTVRVRSGSPTRRPSSKVLGVGAYNGAVSQGAHPKVAEEDSYLDLFLENGLMSRRRFTWSR
eukprot:4478045-Pyramimonas_sp.AAC.2